MSILKKLLKRGDCKATRIIARTGIDYCGTLGNAKECTAELRSPLGLLSTRTAENGRFTAFLTVNQRGVGGCLRHVGGFQSCKLPAQYWHSLFTQQIELFQHGL